MKAFAEVPWTLEFKPCWNGALEQLMTTHSLEMPLARMNLTFRNSHGETLIFQETLAELINSLSPSLTVPETYSINILSIASISKCLSFD